MTSRPPLDTLRSMIDGSVGDVQSLAPGILAITLRFPTDALIHPEILPGQFMMLRLPDHGELILPRAYAILDCKARGSETVCEVLFKVVGRQTRALSQLRGGDSVQALLPLGRGMPAEWDQPGNGIDLVAGGTGLSGIFLAARRVREARVRIFYGARAREELVLLDRLTALNVPLHLATLDGSLGFQGTIVEAYAVESPPVSVQILGCGPTPMLRALNEFARARGQLCSLSLEQPMGCGVGLCLGCVLPVREASGEERWRVSCLDGPIVDGALIDWERF